MRELGKFKAWCRRVLPAVYDDSLSYYEQLAKLVAKLNEVIENANASVIEIENLKTSYTTLKDYVDHYFDNLDVTDAINDKLDSMAEDGTLDEIINQHIFDELNEAVNGLQGVVNRIEPIVDELNNPTLDKSVRGFDSLTAGMNVMKIGNYIHQFITDKYSTEFDANLDAGLSLSKRIERNTAYPVQYPVITGCASDDEMYITNCNSVNPARVRFRLVAPRDDYDFSEKEHYVSLNIVGERAKPKTYPAQPYSGYGTNVVNVVKTYVQAREGGRAFAYGANFIYYGSDKVNDENGRAMMECDTLVFMALCGIPYADSPYADTTPNLTYDFNDLVTNPHSYPWALPWKNYAEYGGRITNTSAMNWYNWFNGFEFTDLNSLKSGDVAIFRRTSANAFDNIGHIGIIEIVNENGVDVPYLYHVSTAQYTDGKIVDRVRLTEFYEKSAGRYRPADTYFMRPSYNQ